MTINPHNKSVSQRLFPPVSIMIPDYGLNIVRGGKVGRPLDEEVDRNRRCNSFASDFTAWKAPFLSILKNW